MEGITKILIVDNDESFLKITKDWFREQGFAVTTAVSGEEALTILDHYLIDVILMDVAMSPMSGLEVLGKIRANPKTSAIPVFMISNIGETEHISRARELGAAGYLVKSEFSLKDVAEKIDKVLHMGM